MTWLARLSLTNRAVVGLVTVLVVAFGLISMVSLRQELFPSLDVPVVTVVTPYPGVSPEVVEQQVTGPVETAVAGIDGVTDTRSTSTGGSSVVTLNLEYGTDLAGAAAQVEQAVLGARLPADAAAQVVSGGTDSLPVVQLAVSSNLGQDEVAAVLRDQVQPLLAGLDGVADVTLSGIVDPRITIDVDTAVAAFLGVPPDSVATVLQSSGVRVPAGQLAPDTDPLTVQVGDPITSVEQLGDLYLTPVTGGAPVRLGAIATITAEPAPASGYTRTNGVASIGIGVTKQEQVNTVAVSQEVRDALPQITDALGGAAQDAQATVVFDQAPFIEQSVDDLTTEGLLGLLFAVLVILGFLLSVRATLVTAVSIPLSVLLAMIVLYVGDHTLNILTLAALTVAVGRVVDDSIVVIENIKRHIGYGGPRRAAILTAIGEVAGAITASTVTTVAVFAPIGLVGGQVGELFRPFAVTVTAALLASLVVSLTVVPVLASLLLHSPATAAPRPSRDDPEAERTRLQRGYLPVLRAAIRRPVTSLAVAVAILVGTVALTPLLQTNFLGDPGGDTLAVSQELASGTGLPQADAAAEQVERVLAATPGVASYQVTVGSPAGGSGGFGPPGLTASTATRFTVSLVDDADATVVADDLRARLTELGDPDEVGTLTVEGGQGGFGTGALAVDIRAEDPDVLARAADQVQQAVAAIPGASEVRNNLAAAQPVVDVAVDRQQAAAAGLTEAQIGRAVSVALRGSTVGTLAIDGVEQDVVLRTGAAPADVAALQTLPLSGPLGPTTLGAVATVTETSTAPSISRTDGARSAQITARPAAADLGAVTADLVQTLDGLTLPAGATATIGGVSAQQADAFAQLGLALLIAIAVVYLVMVVTFRSLLQPLLLLVAIPFAATGVVGLLLLTGTPLGVPALIGMLMLVGIVVTNAIVLIDLVNQYRRSGRELPEAVVEGAAQRLRPIVMTAVATIFALLPMALGFTGGGGFISQPLAVVVIGGLVTSTLLTLVLVPVLYVLAERFRGRSRRAGGPAADVPTADIPTVDIPTAGGPPAGVRAVGSDRSEGAVAVVAPEQSTARAAHGVVTDQDGVALAGIAVAVFDTEGATLGTTTSDEHGGYRLELPDAGEYLLVGHVDEREPTAQWLTVTEPTVRRDLTVAGPANIAGQVRAEGVGVVAKVTAMDQAGVPVAGARAGADGRYRLVHVPEGEHYLLVAPPEGPSATSRVLVPVTGTVHQDVDLPPSGPASTPGAQNGRRKNGDGVATGHVVTDGPPGSATPPTP